MKLGIIGLGVVGKAIKVAFERAHEIYVHDVTLDTDLNEIKEHCELAYICVPTPTERPSGVCNIDAIRSILTELDPGFSVVIKSTVVPGTTRALSNEFSHLKFAICPEFLRSSHALEDFREQEILVVGTEHDDLAEMIYANHHESGIDILDGFYKITPTQAEVVKYAMNSFFALKVIFGNQFQHLCSLIGEEWGPIKEVLTHPRKRGITDTHLDEFDRYGFDGHCLPKDVAAISNMLEGLDIATNLIKSLSKDNTRYLGMNRNND